MKNLYRRIDPDRLIHTKSWWIIGMLATLAGLLFISTVFLLPLSELSVHQNVVICDKINVTNAISKELSAQEKSLQMYCQNLRAYLNQGDQVDWNTMKNNEADIMESRFRLSKLIQPENQPNEVLMNHLVDKVLAHGTQVLELWQTERRNAAWNEIAHLEPLNLHNQILSRSNSLFRAEVDLLDQQIKEDNDLSRSPFRYIQILLSSLAGLVFILLIFSMVRTVRRVMDDRRAYRQISEEQKITSAFNQNLINIMPIGYHSLDNEGYIIDMNQTELDWLGYTYDEIVGKKHISDLFEDGYRSKFAGTFSAYKRDGNLTNLEMLLVGKSGQIIPVLVNAKAIRDSNGNIAHSISTVYNFTKRKELEDELVVARQAAENAQHLKQLFMANMSHEIRTPLNAILGFTNLLARAPLLPNLKEYVQSIQISGVNLLAIVNDILDFEKIQSGMLRIEQIEFDLPGLLHSVVTMMRPSAVEKGLILHLDADPLLPNLVLGDPMRLTQILINLLSNAIKFTEKGSVTLRVVPALGSTPYGPVRICFEVIDTGLGISEAEHERIFERFTQACSDTMRIYGGTGLGLALVKMLVELQQGSIHLVSALGQGSTFSAEIPYLLPLSCKQEMARPGGQSVCLPDFKGHHILLVEDNAMNRRIAEIQLLEFGLHVTLATNGQEAVALLRANPTAFSLVFMDIQMPEMDGYATTHCIHSSLHLTNLPIIAITAHVLAGERDKVLACGMNDYLTKPVRPAELAAILSKYLPSQPLPHESALNISL